jgi:Xaa-Pro aminopeptidase
MPASSVRGIGINQSSPLSPTIGYTDNFIPGEALDFFKRRAYRQIGIYRPQLVPFGMIDYIRENLPGVEFVDATDLVDTIKTIKSHEELEAHKNAIRIHDEIHEAIPMWLRPGRTEREVTMDIRKAALDLGCEEMNIMIGGAAARSYHVPVYLQNEILRSGYNTEIVIEFSASGGYYGELQRMWCIDCEPFPALKRAMDGCYELQSLMAKAAKPGTPCSEMRAIMLKYQELHGFEKDNRVCGHAQGVDLVERPVFFFGETMTFREDMFISIHPPCGDREAYCNACDNFLVTKDGAVRLTKTEQKIFIA